MKSKRLSPFPQGNTSEDDVGNLELFQAVQDEAHEVQQSKSMMDEKRTVVEKEMNARQKMGRTISGQSDLEAERLLEKELRTLSAEDAKEQKVKQQVRQKRWERNKDLVENATDQQIKRLQAIQADFIAKADNQVANEMQSVRVLPEYQKQRDSLLQAGDSLSNLISMVINDKLMNMGKDKTYEEHHIGERGGMFGPYQGRQKTIVINGAVVTLDEDVAHAIEHMRSPTLGSAGSKRLYSRASGLTNKELRAMQKEVEQLLIDIQEIIQNNGKVLDKMDMQMSKQLQKSVDQVNQEIRVNTQNLAQQEENRLNRYEASNFAKLEAQMEADRQQALQQQWVVPRYRSGKQGLYDEYDRQAEQQRQLECQRQIPQISWEVVEDYEYLPDGRQVPILHYEEQVDYVYAY